MVFINMTIEDILWPPHVHTHICTLHTRINLCTCIYFSNPTLVNKFLDIYDTVNWNSGIQSNAKQNPKEAEKEKQDLKNNKCDHKKNLKMEWILWYIILLNF